MGNPKKPTYDQKKLISKAGLDPDGWLVLKENKDYLYLVDRPLERRENHIIDRKTGELVK